MISTVTVTKTVEALVLVEHPDGWTADEVNAALKERALDFADSPALRNAVWEGDSRSKITAVNLDQDLTDGPDAEDGGEDAPRPYGPDPFELTEEDLPEDGAEEEAVEEEPAEDVAADDAVEE